MNKTLLLALFLSPLLLTAQSRKERKAMEARMKADHEVLERIKSHVQFLSNDSLQSSKDRFNSEAKARNYIANAFKELGLVAPFGGDYTQQFTVEKGKAVASATHFKLNGHELKAGEDFIPLAYSANTSVTGMPAIDLREAGEPWFADIKDWIQTANDSNSINIHQLIKKEVDRAKGKKATALILYNSSTHADPALFDKQDASAPAPIPVVYLTNKAYQLYCTDRSALLDIDLNVALKEVNRSASNVAGYLDNGAPNTIVIAAHYDRPGTDEQNPGNTPGVNNELADNAGGTAALIELARLLKNSGAKKNNYLFVAFAAEEASQLGSSYFLDHLPIPPGNINYMVNLERISRYDAARKLTVGGAATSDQWGKLVSQANVNQLAINVDTTNVAKGDHSPFYDRRLPVMYFFTGSQADYPASVTSMEKLNLEGEVKIVRLVERLIENTDDKGKIAFTQPVLPAQVNKPASYTVSLGVIPDNGYAGKGFKIGGVTPKRLADKIGLKAGDILLQLGDYEITEMNSYLQALGRFKEGDSTTLKVLRGNDEKKLDISF